MGTLQQELTKLTTLDNLAFDDDPTPPPPTIQENTMPPTSAAVRGEEKTKRQLYWEWLREHPSSTAREIADAFNVSQMDTATVLSKFADRGLVERTKHNGVYCYTTTVAEYPVISVEQRITNMLAARAKAGKRKYTKREQTARVAVEKTLEERKREIIAPTVGQGFIDSTQTFINSLTVHQAKAVYDELKKIFGG